VFVYDIVNIPGQKFYGNFNPFIRFEFVLFIRLSVIHEEFIPRLKEIKTTWFCP